MNVDRAPVDVLATNAPSWPAALADRRTKKAGSTEEISIPRSRSVCGVIVSGSPSVPVRLNEPRAVPLLFKTSTVWVTGAGVAGVDDGAVGEEPPQAESASTESPRRNARQNEDTIAGS